MAKGYDHGEIEKRAQEKWATLNLYETDLSNSDREPYYLLFEFPYPSGDLHIGHWYAYALTDIFARFKRMQGKNVLFPIGFDAFGLPAENAAIKHGKDPKAWTYDNMERMRAQIRSIGTSVDWAKEVVTCDPSYYKWTQWLFTKLYEHDLAYRAQAPVKWCPKDQTVLANEQVIDGKCERCGSEVEEKKLTQWFMKITDYAERLLTDLEPLPWREDIKEAQRAWIGKSEGAKIPFELRFTKYPELNDGSRDHEGNPAQVVVFTTRPDTIYGATYIVLAPEHPWVRALWDTEHDDAVENKDEIARYVEATQKKTERERQEGREKTGVKIEGIVAINPATSEEIPVFVADYVLASYGTGAVMAVPAHDERDAEFATVMNLPFRTVVMPSLVDAGNPPVEGKPEVARTLALAIVRNPKDDTYLTLSWKHEPWNTFVTGGIDEGEDLVEGALREIREETGYTDVRFVRTLGGPVETRFFASHKDENRVARGTTLLFELASDAREEVDASEAQKHEVVWRTRNELTRTEFRHAEIDLIRTWLAHDTRVAYTGDGTLVNSGEFDGRNNREAMGDIVTHIGGERTTNYRIRDWLVSRQRYWGCPIPVVYDPEGKPHAVPSEHLPWLLPDDVDFTPSGQSPLATSKELRERVERIFGEGWTPEFDTLDTFVDSSWYFLRYLDPKDEHDFSDQRLMKEWLPVDRYSGGSEHTTMHLLYARFFHKALYDLALVPTPEPFHERNNRGLILGPDGQKMSKSRGNVINPDEFVAKYGADAVRMYLAFIGPYNEPGNYPWNLDGVLSMRRFLDRVETLSHNLSDDAADEELMRSLARAAQKTSDDTERLKYNTAISALMVCIKDFEALATVPRGVYRDFVRLLAPFAPHLAEHLWERVGEEGSIHVAPWPTYDASLLAEATATVVVQINGKRRGELALSPAATEPEALEAARAIPAVAEVLGDAAPDRVIYVPGRILNLVKAP